MKRKLICSLILILVLSLAAAAAGFSNQNLDIGYKKGCVVVSGSFDASENAGLKYNVFLTTYSDFGFVSSVELSETFTIKSGANTFSHNFTMKSDEQKVRAFVLTETFEPVCADMTKTVVADYIDWQTDKDEFYSAVTDSRFTSGTDFSEFFKEDNEVTVVEAIAVASNLHAMYKDREINEKDPSSYVHVIDMDDASKLVDLSDRNSVNLDGINFTYAEGGIDEENSYLYGTSVKKDNGGYDPQVVINGLQLEARHYNKMTVRLKYETVSGNYINLKKQYVQIFYKTSNESGLSEDKSVGCYLTDVKNPKEWFELEFDLTEHTKWKDIITGIRIDPLNNIAKFYIDYVKFTKSEKVDNSEWFDPYLAYAVDNGIIKSGQYTESEFYRPITREELFDMFVRIYPESYFTIVNSKIKGVPDVHKNDKYSEVYLLLYKSGITLGFDSSGNIGLDKTLKRSDVAGLINRLVISSNRLKGTVSSSWDSQGSSYDVEFNTSSDRYRFSFKRATVSTPSNGSMKLVCDYDAYMDYNRTFSVDASRFTNLRVRVKAEYTAEPTNKKFEFFYKPQGVSSFGDYYISTDVSDYYLDPLGWYIFDVDLSLDPNWKGTITDYRLDMINDAGTYTIDYIRFVESKYYGQPSDHQGLIDAGYTATRLMQDEHFENGFYVAKMDQSVSALNHGKFNSYSVTGNNPLWTIGPWWQGSGEGFTPIDLWTDRDTTTDKYTLADKYGVNTIVYNPEEKSISQRLNATKIYNGKPHENDTYKWWPHQLIEQSTTMTGDVDKERNSADADRMFVELDVRMTDFKNTTNANGTNVCSYLIYFYLRPKEDPKQRIWFGLTVFNTSASTDNPTGLTASNRVTPTWSPDSAAHQYMYGMPQAVVFGGIENSFNPSKGEAAVSKEWKKIRLDVTPHIDRAIEWANRDNIFEKTVTKEDMYFDGVNIGYEIHGNYDCTIEFKNFNMVSYNK